MTTQKTSFQINLRINLVKTNTVVFALGGGAFYSKILSIHGIAVSKAVSSHCGMCQ